MKVIDGSEVKQEEVKEQESITQLKVKSDSGEVIVDIEEFIKFGSIQKEIKVGNFVIVMQTLKDKERQKATGLIDIDISKSVNEYVEKLKKPLLAYSIVKLNSIPFISDEDKKKLLSVLNECQDVVIDKLWLEYNKMSNEQFELLENEELKKK